ncbi:hypothetical protein [Gracilibacillus sp. JCM 18860]|uniref:hypothetical protein n=1 Tax=Gracilibacillus sp. JCM 18860 TaxID=1306159 RepID=UPI0006D0F47C
MNKIAIVIKVIGVLALIGGIIVGFNLYETPLEGYDYLTEKDYSVLFTWIAYGIIICFIFLGFGEIITLLQKSLNEQERQTKQLYDMHNAMDDDDSLLGKDYFNKAPTE